MENIQVNWELTPSQRSALLNALLAAQRHSPTSEDLQTLITLTAQLKCGDPHCSFCGNGGSILPEEDAEEEKEPDPEEEYGNRIDYEYEKWRDQ